MKPLCPTAPDEQQIASYLKFRALGTPEQLEVAITVLYGKDALKSLRRLFKAIDRNHPAARLAVQALPVESLEISQ